MHESEKRWLRYSLVFVWLATAGVSLWEINGQSRDLLLASGVQDGRMATLLIGAGAGLDALLGALLWFRPRRGTYWLALLAMLGMTLAASFMQPALWLHPLGPLTKNVPIAAMLLVLSAPGRPKLKSAPSGLMAAAPGLPAQGGTDRRGVDSGNAAACKASDPRSKT